MSGGLWRSECFVWRAALAVEVQEFARFGGRSAEGVSTWRQGASEDCREGAGGRRVCRHSAEGEEFNRLRRPINWALRRGRGVQSNDPITPGHEYGIDSPQRGRPGEYEQHSTSECEAGHVLQYRSALSFGDVKNSAGAAAVESIEEALCQLRRGVCRFVRRFIWSLYESINSICRSCSFF